MKVKNGVYVLSEADLKKKSRNERLFDFGLDKSEISDFEHERMDI